MPKANVQIVQELLAGATNPEVVNALVAPNATYVSLTYDNPDLHKIMPWAGTHKAAGPAAILKTFQDVNTFWTVEAFEPRQALGDGESVAEFGSFTLRSTKLDRVFTSPFASLATVKNGQVASMRYMEGTFGTGSTFRSGGAAKYQNDPARGEVEP